MLPQSALWSGRILLVAILAAASHAWSAASREPKALLSLVDATVEATPRHFATNGPRSNQLLVTGVDLHDAACAKLPDVTRLGIVTFTTGHANERVSIGTAARMVVEVASR